MTDNDLNELVLAVLEKAPAWVRSEFSSADKEIRARAEETLAAMLTAAVSGTQKLQRQ